MFVVSEFNGTTVKINTLFQFSKNGLSYLQHSIVDDTRDCCGKYFSVFMEKLMSKIV